METMHQMPVWAPSVEELGRIERRVAKARAKVVRDLFRAIGR